jgi:hypothetical protein
MTRYQKIFNAKKAAWIEHERKGGFIRWLCLKYWQYRYDTLTVGGAVKVIEGAPLD